MIFPSCDRETVEEQTLHLIIKGASFTKNERDSTVAITCELILTQRIYDIVVVDDRIVLDGIFTRT